MSLTQQPSLKLTLSATACILFLVGCSSTPKFPAAHNPFSTDGSNRTGSIEINTLRAFGDSYTAFDYAGPNGLKSWTTELTTLVPTNRLENYAFGGARSNNVDERSFGRQIRNWERSNSDITNRDLTVVYFGYNDVGLGGRSTADINASKAAYANNVNRLVEAGASTGSNRIFVTQIHDRSLSPFGSPQTGTPAHQDWNAFVAGLANANSNVIAVDLYTVFDRVVNNPAQFGLVNVTNVNAARSSSDYLYYAGSHFGSKGQEIIARTYRHYLTRGWNWANALNAGSEASEQLRADITMGALDFSGGKSINQSVRLLPLMSKGSGTAPNGLSFDMKTSPLFGQSSGRLGLAYGETAKNTLQTPNSTSFTTTGIQSNATSLYWMQPSGGFFYTAQVSQNRHKFDQQGHDDILRNSVQNQRSANTLSFESAVRYSFGLGQTTFTPWVSLSQEQHVLNASTDRSLYTTDVSYRQSKITDTYSGIGMDFALGKVSLSGGNSLVMGGGINHVRALQRDALRLQSSEAINGIVSTEVFERGFEPRTQLSLNADLVLKQQYQFGLTYRVEPEQRSNSQALELKAKIPF
jgi:lysophospholipase L1-like esterase